MEYDSVMEKNKIAPFVATWMDLEIILPSEVSQTEKDKYHVMSLMCGIKNTAQMSPSMKQTCGCQCRGWGGGRMDWEVGLADAHWYLWGR